MTRSADSSRFYAALTDLAERRVRLILEAHAPDGPIYDPSRPRALRAPQAVPAPVPSTRRRYGPNRTGVSCSSCGAITYGISDRCGKCGARS